MIKKLKKDDTEILKKVFELEKKIFENNFYSYKEFENMLDDKNYEILVYEDVKGYLILHDSFDIYEIMKIGVDKNFRKLGIGRRLINFYSENFEKNLFLEVREKNEIAKKFYEKLEFKIIGKRKKYYSDGETALLMSLETV